MSLAQICDHIYPFFCLCLFWAFFSFLKEKGTVFSFFFCVLVENSGVLWLPASLPSGDAVLLSSACPERGHSAEGQGYLWIDAHWGLTEKGWVWSTNVICELYIWAASHSTYVGATTEHADVMGSTDPFVWPSNLSYCRNKYKCSPELLYDFTVTTRYAFDTVQLLNISAVRQERDGEGSGRGLKYLAPVTGSGLCEFLLLHRPSDKT